MPFEKGNKLGNRFRPGQSGNPGGRPSVASEIREKAKDLTMEAFEQIVALMRGADKDAVRLSASVRVLQIAGVPVDGSEIHVTVNGVEASNPYADKPTGALLDAAARPN